MSFEFGSSHTGLTPSSCIVAQSPFAYSHTHTHTCVLQSAAACQLFRHMPKVSEMPGHLRNVHAKRTHNNSISPCPLRFLMLMHSFRLMHDSVVLHGAGYISLPACWRLIKCFFLALSPLKVVLDPEISRGWDIWTFARADVQFLDIHPERK